MIELIDNCKKDDKVCLIMIRVFLAVFFMLEMKSSMLVTSCYSFNDTKRLIFTFFKSLFYTNLFHKLQTKNKKCTKIQTLDNFISLPPKQLFLRDNGLEPTFPLEIPLCGRFFRIHVFEVFWVVHREALG